MDAPAHFDVASTPLESGVTLLEASAGTGKTYSLTGVVLRMLLEGRIARVDEALLVTFTNAAAVELRNRLRALLRDALAIAAGADPGGDAILQWVSARRGDETARVLRLALLQFDRVRVQTLHSFCAQLLRESAFEAGFTFDSDEAGDADALLREAVEDQWRIRMHEGESWWPALAVVEGWTPASFLADVRERRKHPDAIVLPDEPSRAEVDARLAAAFESVVSGCDPGAMRAELAPLNWKKTRNKKKLDSELCLMLLDALESETDRRSPWSVEKWLRLRGSRIQDSLYKRDLEKLGERPWMAPLQELDDACGPGRDALRLEILAAAESRFDRAKRRAQRLDFDDLVERVRSALRDPATAETLRRSARQKIRVALIDEFQDTDLRQWEIFEALFADLTMYLVGDPKQAIYGFRGADVYAYLRAMNRADRRYTLPRNYRSHPGLVSAVNELFTAGSDPFVVDRIRFAPAEAAISEAQRRLEGDDRPTVLLHLVEGDPGEALSRERADRRVLSRLADEIQGLLGSATTIDGERLHPEQIAVLVRTHHEGEQVADTLRDRGIPAVRSKMGDIHQSETMLELALVLDAILQPRSGRHARRAAATWLWGLDAVEVARCRDDEDAGGELLLALSDLRRRWQRDGFVAMTHALVTERDVVGRWLRHADGERRLTDLRHSIEVLHASALQNGLSPEGLVHWLWRERERDHNAQEDLQLRLERDARAVQILTMHVCKGLEFEVVMVPFAWWEKQLPDSSALRYHKDDDEMTLDWRSSDRGAIARHEAERMAEDVRLLYVALTRAKRRCVLFEADAEAKNVDAGAARSATSFLLHRPERKAGEDAAAWVKRSVDEIRATRSQRRDRLESRIARSKAMGWLEDGAPAPGRVEPPTPAKRREHARPLDEMVADRLWPWQVASFTSLARRFAETPERFADHLDPASLSPELELEPRGIFAFARGARAGTCLHAVLERSDLTRELDAPDRTRIERTLALHGLDVPEAHAAVIDPLEEVCALVDRVRREEFPGRGFTLGEIDPDSRRDEWAFRARLGTIDTSALAAIFERHARGRVCEEAASQLRGIRGQTLRGFLAGFVDLVFVHEGRWYVVDWKSNHLGNVVDDYAERAVWEAMLEHQYVLQYHLYVLALHRFLRLRVASYDYEVHFGGVAYLFLRGLCGDPRRGWYVDRPPRELIEALDLFFDGEVVP